MSADGNGAGIRGAIKAVCDIVRRGKNKGARNYIAELTWILFLRMLDDREEREAEHAAATGARFQPTLCAPYRWRDWASPQSAARKEMSDKGRLLDFAREKLFPHLKGLRGDGNIRRRVVGQIIAGVGEPRAETATDLLDILDRIHLLRDSELDRRHDFPISRVYEDLLLDMSQDGRDTGQFFTPREVIRAMVRVVDPKPGEKVMDPCCGTGGFLAQAREHIQAENPNLGGKAMGRLKEETFYGREQDGQIYPSALANMVMHGVDRPNIWHGDTLTDTTYFGGLFENAPPYYDVVLTNPPFGAKLKKTASARFDYPSSSSQVLFMQEIIRRTLADGGRCGMVVDEGFMFGAGDSSVSVRRMLVERCDLECVVSLPPNVFASVGAGVKTNLLFFRKGKATSRIWYYDLSGVKLTKKRLLTLEDFADFFRKRPGREEGERSWVADFSARKAAARKASGPHEKKARSCRAEAARLTKEMAKARGDARLELKAKRKAAEKQAKQEEARAKKIMDSAYDLRATNPNRKPETDSRTPERLLGIVSAKNREIASLLSELKATESVGG